MTATSGHITAHGVYATQLSSDGRLQFGGGEYEYTLIRKETLHHRLGSTPGVRVNSLIGLPH